MSEHMQVLEELTQNLNRVRMNAETLGRTEIVKTIDMHHVRLGQAISLSKLPDSINNPEEFGQYIRFVNVAVRLLGGIYNTESANPNIRRQLFIGYQKINGFVAHTEFENYTENVEPAILRDAFG